MSQANEKNESSSHQPLRSSSKRILLLSCAKMRVVDVWAQTGNGFNEKVPEVRRLGDHSAAARLQLQYLSSLPRPSPALSALSIRLYL